MFKSMRAKLIAAAFVALAIGGVVAAKAQATQCFTNCYGNSCTTSCY